MGLRKTNKNSWIGHYQTGESTLNGFAIRKLNTKAGGLAISGPNKKLAGARPLEFGQIVRFAFFLIYEIYSILC
jgi:hypothetical protein